MNERLIFIVILFTVLTGCKKDFTVGLSINNLIETAPPVQKAVNSQINGSINGFYEALPARYSETKINYPLLVCFHGAGQLGKRG